jgi:hypothetical protein
MHDAEAPAPATVDGTKQHTLPEAQSPRLRQASAEYMVPPLAFGSHAARVEQ